MTRTQAALATATLVVLDAAAGTGHIDPGHHTQRLCPALEASQRAWSGAARAWLELTTPTSTASADLAPAAHELRATLRQIAHDQHGWATPDVIDHRIDLTQAVPMLRRAAAAASDLAHLASAIAADDDLHGPARVLLHLTKSTPPPRRRAAATSTTRQRPGSPPPTCTPTGLCRYRHRYGPRSCAPAPPRPPPPTCQTPPATCTHRPRAPSMTPSPGHAASTSSPEPPPRAQRRSTGSADERPVRSVTAKREQQFGVRGADVRDDGWGPSVHGGIRGPARRPAGSRSSRGSLVPEAARFTAKTTVLIETVIHHIDEEEKDWFPKVRQALSRLQLRQIGERLIEVRKSAPRHPAQP